MNPKVTWPKHLEIFLSKLHMLDINQCLRGCPGLGWNAFIGHFKPCHWFPQKLKQVKIVLLSIFCSVGIYKSERRNSHAPRAATRGSFVRVVYIRLAAGPRSAGSIWTIMDTRQKENFAHNDHSSQPWHSSQVSKCTNTDRWEMPLDPKFPRSYIQQIFTMTT